MEVGLEGLGQVEESSSIGTQIGARIVCRGSGGHLSPVPTSLSLHRIITTARGMWPLQELELGEHPLNWVLFSIFFRLFWGVRSNNFTERSC